jgi:hypothetical protein
MDTIDNFQFDESAGFAQLRAFAHSEPLSGVDVTYQNYSLIEKDTQSHQIGMGKTADQKLRTSSILL